MRVLKYVSQFDYLPPGEFIYEGKMYLKIEDCAHPIRLLTEEEILELITERHIYD